MTNWAIVSATAIAASPQLKIVARLGVGIDNIAVDEATKRGIWVTNVPDYSVEEVSDHAVGFVLLGPGGSFSLTANARWALGARIRKPSASGSTDLWNHWVWPYWPRNRTQASRVWMPIADLRPSSVDVA